MRFVLLDIETSPIRADVWNLYGIDSIPYQHVIYDSHIICGSWKFLDNDEIYSVSVMDDPIRFVKNHRDDYYVVKKIHEVLSTVDGIIAHNGARFDWPKFYGRVVYHNLDALHPPAIIDTLKYARQFKFSSNKLDDLGTLLGTGNKIKNEPGLFSKAADGDVEAIRSLVTYNRGDIPPLEALYYRLRPYIKGHPNMSILSDVVCCTKCSSTDFHGKGPSFAHGVVKHRYKCNVCGNNFYGKESLRRPKAK